MPVCGKLQLSSSIAASILLITITFVYLRIYNLFENNMNAQQTPKTVFSPADLKLFVYGSRQNDQFWFTEQRFEIRRPFCLSDVQKFTINNEDEDDKSQQNKKSQSIPNPLYNQAIYKIACGSLHNVILTTDGKVFTFGCNDEGALGRRGTQCIPIQVKLQDPIDLIAAGDNHSLFANSHNGAIYFTGNYNYKRGEKMTESVFSPIKIFASEINITNKNKRIQKLACGSNHSCILINNKIYCRGEPEANTIGRRSSKRHKVENSLTFNGINLSNVEDIECGGYHTVAKVVRNGKRIYYSWGTNYHGQLGIGTFQNEAYPVEISKLHDKNIVQIAAGAEFTLFLTEQGDLYGCGNNEYGMLGLGQDFQYQSELDDSNNQNQRQSQKDVMKKMQQVSMNQGAPLKNENQVNQAQQSMKNQSIQPNEDVSQEEHKEQKQKLYIKTPVKIELPETITNIAAGENFGFGWNQQSLYSWGLGNGYVLLTGQQNEEMSPFKVKNKIINNHTIYQLDAGSQHVMYTSYPETIKQGVKIQLKPSVWENLSLAKHGLKRK